jgi:hypothetical protein
MVHFLGDDDLKLTFIQLYDRINPGGRLILRAVVPPTGHTSWTWRQDSLRLKLNKIRPCHRSAENIKALLIQTGFQIEQIEASGTKGELVWLFVSKKSPDEKN